MQYLKKENTNNKKCKSCMFNYNENSVKLSSERMAEILNYLVNLKQSHVCHTTNKTCYGGLEIQARVLFDQGLIPQPTPESLIQTANIFLNG